MGNIKTRQIADKGCNMKSILTYGQTVLKRNKGQADTLDVFQSGVKAMRDGYNVQAFERIQTNAGTFIKFKRGAK